ncbi:unnamed protein product [Rotaria sordida]|uniref:Uncharacterized protein n=1 Tax=Rotaria sordida TaxID=392033 RepID=A0A815SUN7_9BILA|nr:unnamed protein product [Rotaria sordida]
MQFQFNLINITFACLLIFICFIINNKIDARALRRNVHDAAIQNIQQFPHLVLRKKRDTLTDLDDDDNVFQQDERYLDDEVADTENNVDDREQLDNDRSFSSEGDNQALRFLNHNDDVDSPDNSGRDATDLDEESA